MEVRRRVLFDDVEAKQCDIEPVTLRAASADVGALIARPMAMAMVRPIRATRREPVQAAAIDTSDVDAFVVAMYNEHGRGLVRMVRLFLDDRNAAEDLVQEAFIRLARSADKINDQQRAAAYLRSIVLNLARDHNRRGLVSLRHRVPTSDSEAALEDTLELSEDIAAVISALRELAPRQRDCLVLRYYDELGIDDIAETLGLSRNSVKTHLTRGLRALEAHLEGTAVSGRESVGIEP